MGSAEGLVMPRLFRKRTASLFSNRSDTIAESGRETLKEDLEAGELVSNRRCVQCLKCLLLLKKQPKLWRKQTRLVRPLIKADWMLCSHSEAEKVL